MGIEIGFEIVELETLYTHWRKGAADEINAGWSEGGSSQRGSAEGVTHPTTPHPPYFVSSAYAPVQPSAGGSSWKSLMRAS